MSVTYSSTGDGVCVCDRKNTYEEVIGSLSHKVDRTVKQTNRDSAEIEPGLDRCWI